MRQLFTNIFTNTAWRIWTGIWVGVAALLIAVLGLSSGLGGAFTLGILILGFYLITTMCVFWLPKRMVTAKTDDRTRQLEPKDSLDLENDIRTTLVQVVAGAALIGTFFYGFQQLNATQQQILDAREQFEVQQAAERFARAIDDLSKEQTEARLGGIATLVQIAESSITRRNLPQRSKSRVQRHDYQEDVLGYLAGFLRSISRGKHPTYDGDPQALPALAVRLPEAQAAIDAISRLNDDRPNQPAKKQLELFKADLIGARLENARLNNLDLTGAYLTGADLRQANLEGANLKDADLRGANLEGAVISDETTMTEAIADKCPDGRTDTCTVWPNNTKPAGVLEPKIEITSPANPSKVPYRIRVTGEWNDLRKDAHIWVAVYVKKVKRYYPHDRWLDYADLRQEPRSTPHGRQYVGVWEIPDGVAVGQENERGQPFALVAIMADSEGTRAFQDYLSQQEKPGMLALPMGATELSRVNVTRE